MVWAQRKDKIFLTVQLDNIRNPKIDVKETSLHFRATAGKDNTEYEVLLEFNKEIDPEVRFFFI